MGHKVHPIGFRLGIVKDWSAKWYADKAYHELVAEDIKIRKAVLDQYREGGISRVEIDRQPKQVTVTIHTARPGVVIGRGGQRVEEMRGLLDKVTGKKVKLNILEISQPELDATLVARSVAEQLVRQVAFRRAMKQALTRSMQAGAKGVKILCSGRLAGAEIARREAAREGRVPLHTLRADIDFGLAEARTTMGDVGVKVWIYRGDILPEAKETEVEVDASTKAGEVPQSS